MRIVIILITIRMTSKLKPKVGQWRETGVFNMKNNKELKRIIELLEKISEEIGYLSLVIEEQTKEIKELK